MTLWCLSHISAGRVVSSGSVRCGSALEILLASGGRPPRFQHSSEGLGLSPGARGAPKRGMPAGPEAFLELPDAFELRLCDRNHLKNGLVPHSCAFFSTKISRLNPTSRGRIRLTSQAESHITWSHSPYFRGWILHLAFHYLDKPKVLLRTIRGLLLQVGVSLTVLTVLSNQTARRYTRRGLYDHPVLTIRSVPLSLRPLSCAALKHGLALAVGSLDRFHSCAALKHGSALAVSSFVHLHGCAALKHGLAFAIGSLVRLHGCTAQKHGLALAVDSLIRSSALAQQRHDHFGNINFDPDERLASPLWLDQHQLPASNVQLPLYDSTNISYSHRTSTTSTIPATDTNHQAENTIQLSRTLHTPF